MKAASQFPLSIKAGSVTAKIYQTPTGKGYDSFTLVYWHDSVRKREVFGSLAVAKKRGGLIAKALAKGEIKTAQISAQDTSAFLRASALLKPTGVTLESACREFAEAYKLLKGVSILQAVRDYARRHAGEITNKMVAEVVTELLQAKREGRATRIRGNGRVVSNRYLQDLEHKLNAFAETFHCKVGAVTGTQINEFLSGLEAGGRTRNNYRQAINVFYEFARKQKYVSRDHAILDEVETVAEADFEIEIFTPEELVKILNHADDILRPVLVIGAFAGLRSSEIERLDWDDVRFETSSIIVQKGKVNTKRGRARRLVPLLTNLAAWLKPMAQQPGKVWPFSAPYLFELQAKAATDAGVKWRHNALRHSYISYRVATTANVNEAALEAGNSPQMIFEHYRELVTREESQKWFSIIPEADSKAFISTPAPEDSNKSGSTEGIM